MLPLISLPSSYCGVGCFVLASTPERITWIPLTETHTEHLQQYQHVDIALDPLPNGGCTTTCEALWMGAPVITKAGCSYVSRMSTAVLDGCGLQDWVAADEHSYVQLAVEQAANLHQLRDRRARWRQQINPAHSVMLLL